MPGYLLKRYKSIQQQSFLQQPARYRQAYAIAGTGKHAFTNLYPCIWHLGLPVKSVYSATLANATAAAGRWNNCSGTNDINTILNDQSIKGVIVALPPAQQATTTRLLLEAGKQVFVEKPVGLSAAALKEVFAAQKNNICQVGLQRRFAPATDILLRQCSNAQSYNYRFLLGAYPEGNCAYDLFIHPLDFVTQVFGQPVIEHITTQKDNTGMTSFITLSHGALRGSIELSTHYSWQHPVDEIVVNTKSKIITARYPGHVSAIIKPARLFNIPIEKVWPRPLQQEIYLENTFIPSADMNSLQLQGFYPQLKYFAGSVENNRRGKFSSLESLLPVYEILDRLQH